MNGMLSKRSNVGFTLLELVTVMLIVAIVAAIGLPSFKYVTNSNRMAMEINGLLGDMQFARSEAIKEGLPVTVCASTNAADCDAGAGNDQWHSGWMIFLDTNGNGVRDTGESVIRIQPAFTSTDTFIADTTFPSVVFNRLGYAATGSATDVTIKLHSTPTNSSWTRCLRITPVGMMNTEKASVLNCT
ncbi:MAG TPA: GspH/FimT family pseudopilin [Steroidobacteraceae bacterium]